MQRITLGLTPLMVSRLTLGTMTFGAQTSESVAASMLDFCLERGVNFIDTANVYNAGVTEQILGRLLAGRRDQVVLATKVGIRMGDGPTQCGLSRKAILQGIDDSLRRLNTDHVDLFYLHQPDNTVPLEESLETLNELVQAGKVLHLGASNYASWQVCRMLWLADKMNWKPISVAQPMYNLLARRVESEFLPMARQHQVAVVPYNPLAGGLLTGKHRQDQDPIGTRFEKMPIYRDRYWNSQTFDAVNRLAGIARECGKTPIELAFSWLLAQPGVSSVIVGASQFEQLRQNIEAAESAPPAPEVLAKCDDVWNQLCGASPTYNR